MSSLLINEDFLKNVEIITKKIIKAHSRWNNGRFKEIYNKTIFKLILIDYYFINKFKKLFINLEINLMKILELDSELIEKLNNNLEFSIVRYINNVFDEQIPVTIDLNSIITHYLETRDVLSRFLYNHIKDAQFKLKKQVTIEIKNWYESITKTYSDFFYDFKSLNQNKENHNYKFIFSQDMYRSFKSTIDAIQQDKKNILYVASYINFIPLTLWFDEYEVTVVSDNAHQLRHLHFTVEQFKDLTLGLHFTPNNRSRLLPFNVLYDEVSKLERFGDLEENNYIGILCNYPLSQCFDFPNKKENFSETTIQFFERLKFLLQDSNESFILIQEESKYMEIIEQSLEVLGFKIFLKISTFEGFERSNWLLKLDK